MVGTKGLVEVEFAGGFEAPTPVWGQHSFTVNLIAELKKVHDSGTTVYDLHRNLWNTLQHYRPQQDGRERRAKPHHEWLAPWPMSQFRSIHLQSLLSTAPIQLQNAARTQTTSLQRARSFDIVKLQAVRLPIQRYGGYIDFLILRKSKKSTNGLNPSTSQDFTMQQLQRKRKKQADGFYNTIYL